MCPSTHSEGRCFITGGGCEITLFPTPEQRTFCLHGGEDNPGSTGTQPRVTTASRAKPAAAQPHGDGGGAGKPSCCCHSGRRPAPWAPLTAAGRGGKPHFLKPGTNFLSEAPVLSRGWTRVLGAVAAGRGARRTAATTTESQSGPV